MYVVPREALRGADTLYVIDADDRLRIRPVEVLRAARDQVFVSAGLDEGVRVCVTTLAAVILYLDRICIAEIAKLDAFKSGLGISDKQVGVVLSGSGVYDGAEIHESVITLLALALVSIRLDLALKFVLVAPLALPVVWGLSRGWL